MAKPTKNNFDDVKMTIATISITMTIIFWNLFASASSNEVTAAAADNLPRVTATIEPIVQVVEPTPTFVGKILLGGQAPQPRVVVQSGGGNNNAGNSGGGAVPTQTKSS